MISYSPTRAEHLYYQNNPATTQVQKTVPRKPPPPKLFSKDYQPKNNPGRPKGSRDRATIVKEILEATDRKTGKQFVDIMTEAVLRRAIKNGDSLAFDKLMDSAYGKIKDIQKLEIDGVKIVRDTTLEDPESLKPLPGEPGYKDGKQTDN